MAVAPADPFLAEIESVHSAQAQPCRGTSQAQATQSHRLVEELQILPIAGRTADSDGELPGTKAVKPEPAEREQGEKGKEIVHGI